MWLLDAAIHNARSAGTGSDLPQLGFRRQIAQTLTYRDVASTTSCEIYGVPPKAAGRPATAATRSRVSDELRYDGLTVSAAMFYAACRAFAPLPDM